jgi:hypothetical protein
MFFSFLLLLVPITRRFSGAFLSHLFAAADQVHGRIAAAAARVRLNESAADAAGVLGSRRLLDRLFHRFSFYFHYFLPAISVA